MDPGEGLKIARNAVLIGGKYEMDALAMSDDLTCSCSTYHSIKYFSLHCRPKGRIKTLGTLFHRLHLIRRDRVGQLRGRRVGLG